MIRAKEQVVKTIPCILEASGSHLSHNTHKSNMRFLWFSSVPQEKYRHISLN